MSIFLFFDFDGTLAPIAPVPQRAKMDTALRQLLRDFAKRGDMPVAILSGRELKDLQRRVPIAGIVHAGNHGLEIQGPGMRFTEPRAARSRPLLARLAARLRVAFRGIPGILVENKGLTLSVHYRRVGVGKTQCMIGNLRRLLARELQNRRLRLTTGKKVIEVRPPTPWGKAQALRWILKRTEKDSGRRFVPVYVGDDTTDEEAFVEAQQRGGFGVFVGRDNVGTRARYRVRSLRALETWLRQFCDAGS